jgi:heterodisulfide reductase subunit A-like polyferredoxin
MVPRPSTKPLLDLFRLSLTEEGFMDAPPLETGVFVTGACRGPKDIDRSILQSKSTASQLLQYLKERN